MTKSRRGARPAEGAQAGFTIIETVIALFVAMVVGFGAVSLFLFSVSYNAGASDRARALALAQQRIEGWRAKPYSQIAATDTTEQVNVGSTSTGKADRRTFEVKTKVEYYDTAASIPANQRGWSITVRVKPVDAGRWSAGEVMLRLLRASDKIGNN